MVRQYIGARYVPVFYENSSGTAEWRSGVMYDPLTIVTWNGNSYTSKKPVPAEIGDPSNNPTYWVATGLYNAQVEQIRQELVQLRSEVQGVVATPEMFGAAGDGVTDDSEAVQDAVNAADVVIFSGRYLLSDIDIEKDVYLIGAGGVIIPKMVAASPAPIMNAFTIREADVVFDGLEFIGISYSGTDISERHSMIDAADSAKLIFRNCTVSGIGWRYANVDGPFWNYTPVYIKAVDVTSVEITDNDFSGNAGDELFMITPRSGGAGTVIEFCRNRTRDNITGCSVNLNAEYVHVEGNLFDGTQYQGSAFNISAKTAALKYNQFIGVSYGSIFDGAEAGIFAIEHCECIGNIVTGAGGVFIHTCGTDLICRDNVVEGDVLAHQELTTHADAWACPYLQNTAVRTNAQVIIEGNKFTLKGTSGGPINRAGSIGVDVASDTPASSFAKQGLFEILNNTFILNGANIPNKNFAATTNIFKKITVKGNLISNPNFDVLSGSAKYLLSIDARNTNPTFITELIGFFENAIMDLPATMTNGVYVGSSITGAGSPVPQINTIDMFHNHTFGGNNTFGVGFDSSSYTTLNS